MCKKEKQVDSGVKVLKSKLFKIEEFWWKEKKTILNSKNFWQVSNSSNERKQIQKIKSLQL